MLTLNDGRSELWQWDTGRKLTVDAECSQVHFSNKFFGRSIDVDVTDGVAVVPDVLLQSDNDLVAWVFVGSAESGYTKFSKTFKVNKRNKPSDYVFTPTEQKTISEIEKRVKKLEESQDPEAIKDAVHEYMEENPLSSQDVVDALGYSPAPFSAVDSKVQLPQDEDSNFIYGTPGQFAVSDGIGGIEWKDAVASSNDRITPQMFGAKADGVTDDSETVQQALDACKETGGTVYFPKGTYFMSAAASVYSNQHLIGEHGAVLLRADGSTTGLLVAAGASNIIIEDLIFDGGDTASQKSYSNLLKMTDTSDVKITDCEFVHGFSSSANANGRNAVKLSGCSDVTVDNCRFADDSRNNTVSASIYVNDESQGVYVTNCVFDSAYTCVGALSDVSDIYFGNNKVNNCYIGINIQGSTYLGYAVNNVMDSDSSNFYTYKTVYGYGNMLNGEIFFRDTLHPHVVLPYYYTDRVAVPTASMTMKTSAVYTLYNELTNSTWNDLTDDDGNAVLREYVFSTGEYNASGLRGERDTDLKKPVFLVMAGIHGNEKAAVVSTYKFFKDLVDGKNMPTYIPEGAVFKVIPVANPSGFDKTERENAAGVDLNRNFAYNWATATEADKNYGTSSESEAETQAITKWLDANKDAVLLLDLHGSGDDTTSGKNLLKEVAMVVGLQNNEFAKKAKMISLSGLDRVVPYWRNVMKLKNVTTYAYSSYVEANGGCVYYAADKLGIPAVALELSRKQNGVTVYMAPDTVSTGAEALGNILLEAYRKVEA